MDPIIEKNPLVSVVMPVYNAEKYVGEAIKSILNQSFTDFEFLIFNDGSKDKSSKIIKSYVDKRIKYFEFNENYGLVKHLNEGIKISRGSYIARMDADDISIPTRFMNQINILNNNSEVGVCSGWIKTFGNRNQVIKYAESDEEIKVNMLIKNSIAHPCAMIRKEVLLKDNVVYNRFFYPIEDFKLWLDLVPFTKFYNIPTILLKYRITNDQITNKLNPIQMELSNNMYLDQLKNIGINPTESEKIIHIKLINNNICDAADLAKVNVWLSTLKEANGEIKYYNQIVFLKFIKELKDRAIMYFVYNRYYKNKNKTIGLVKELITSKSKFYIYLSFSQKVKFLIKLIMRK